MWRTVKGGVKPDHRSGGKIGHFLEISGHKTRAIFDRYNITDEGDIGSAADKLANYFRRRKQERAAKLRRVK
ncbi:MAG TPA: hypothetical protein VNH18_17940 [Bryobacteraceae bacterium]|nr:hypothetical protein [Bryobacteraceae bacterium]HXJ41169.1 hypothetical protein [Bryobacteraceae bacterium]